MTRRVLRTQFLLDAVAEAEEVTVAQEELVEYIVAQAPAYGMDPNSFAQAMDQAGQVPALVQEVARRKALAAVLEKATVTDASGNKVDLGDEDDDAAEGSEEAAEAPAAEEKPKRTRKPKTEAAEAAGSAEAAEGTEGSGSQS